MINGRIIKGLDLPALMLALRFQGQTARGHTYSRIRRGKNPKTSLAIRKRSSRGY